MKKLFIIGNWKSYKNISETNIWFEKFSKKSSEISFTDKEAILCVPFTLLSLAKNLIEKYNLPMQLGAQNISPFTEGKYTGEINGKQIAEFASYVIIGHSERRQYFSDTEETIQKQLERAVENSLIPIICVSEVAQVEHIQTFASQHTNMIIAYEPLFAIGSGQADSPENAERVSAEIQKKVENISIIYGGSVTSQNVHSFTSMPAICGVLPGGASLDPVEFASIIHNA